MDLSSEQRNRLVDLGERLLHAFERISNAADRELSGQRDPIWSPTGAERSVNEIRQALRRLKNEPAIARVKVRWLDTNEETCYYVCRASAGLQVGGIDGRLISYRASLGRLAEIPAGEEEEIILPSHRRDAQVLERVQLRPAFADLRWDSYDNKYDSPDFRLLIESILRLLDHERRLLAAEAGLQLDYLAQVLAQGEARQIYLDQRRRRTVDKMELRDQPVLDQYQGSVFRMPLDKQVFLLGPPGVGKTTALIHRLAQKRTEEGLTPEESDTLDRLGIRTDFVSDTSWGMFSPTELLKLYVREAFNREGVPAASFNLRTWDAERIALGRDTLRFLRGASSGTYSLAENDDALLDCSSKALAALHDEVAEEVDAQTVARCSQAIEWMRESDDVMVREVLAEIHQRCGIGPMTVDGIHTFARHGDIFRAKLDTLTVQIEDQTRALANRLLLPQPSARLTALATVLREDSGQSQAAYDEDDEDENDSADLLTDESSAVRSQRDESEAVKLLLRSVRWLALNTVEGRTRSARGNVGKILEWLGDRIPSPGELRNLGRKVQLQRRLRILERSARDLVFRTPTVYAQFRRGCVERGRWYAPNADTLARRTVLSPAEADILILLMLRNARRASATLGEVNWLKPIQDSYLMQVFVDEATDFSSVQLACMLELSHPKLRAWFACGDFRQRITRHGITDESDLRWIAKRTGVPPLEVREITTDYRQSARLRRLAAALVPGGQPPSAISPDRLPGEEPEPLLAENLSGEQLASWLADRVLEIERYLEKLPSIAVFVEREDRIDPLVASVRPKLAQHNVRIVGCRDGRDIGNRAEVRVFDIRHIKGLEFEAVFFVGADLLACGLPDLFQQFMFVGITRAATFLGVTCEQSLPGILEKVRPLFSDGTWA